MLNPIEKRKICRSFIKESDRLTLPKTTLEQWAVLAAVVDTGGFAQAALALNRSQSAVSYMVARLQESIDLPLLSSEGRRSILTTHGQILLAQARTLLKDADLLERLARGLEDGWEAQLNLVVDAAYPQRLMLAVLAELQDSCPATQIQLSEEVLSGAEEAVTSGRGDVVVTSRVPAGFLSDYLLAVEFVAVACPDHELFQADHPLTARELARYVQAVVRDSGHARPRDEGWLGAARRITVSSMDASLAAVQAGLAYAWLPRHLIEPLLAAGALRELPLQVGATRSVALNVVLVRPDVAGPAANAALTSLRRHSAQYDKGGRSSLT